MAALELIVLPAIQHPPGQGQHLITQLRLSSLPGSMSVLPVKAVM